MFLLIMYTGQIHRLKYVISFTINGKVKSKIKVDSNATDETLQEKALADKKIESLLGLNDPKKIIVISGKLVNIVL